MSIPFPAKGPDTCIYAKENKVSRLQFLDDKRFSGSYVMKGSICFPKILDFTSGKTEGYVLVGGQRVIDGGDAENGKIYIFEERKFVTIDHAIDNEGKIIMKGINTFFNKAWSEYFCRQYFYSQSHEVFKKYQRQILHSVMIKPKPLMKETQLMHEDMHEALATVYEALNKGQLVYRKNGGVHQGLSKVQMVDPDKSGYDPAVYALMCLVNGFLRFPYRKKKGPTKEAMMPKYIYDFERK